MGAPAIVLDAACGLGDSTRLMAERWPAALVVGVNISSAQLAHARHHHSGPAWAAIDAVHLAVADGSVDLIVSVEAVPHFSSRAAFLARPGARCGPAARWS